MKIIKFTLIFVAVVFVSACAAPRYTGTAIPNDTLNKNLEIVVIEDAKTKKGFLAAIENWLVKNNYKYKVEKDGSTHDLDKLTIEYVGFWKWDLALYLSEAKIESFHKGQRLTEVGYKAPNSLNTNKFSNAEERIEYMLNVLFGKISSEEATKAIKSSTSK